jgi:carbamoyl-phosphate synthase large subunit
LCGLKQKLADELQAAKIPILGTSPDAIDMTEDRERFQKFVQRLKLLQPENGVARSAAEAEKEAERVGFPVVLRPSYVLGGRAMEIVHDMNGLRRYVTQAVKVSGDNPVLIDRYLSDATEVDVDVICDGKDVFIAGIMEHIEEAGIHSGDSACSLPPYTLAANIVAEIERQSTQMALDIGVVGLMNVQFAVKDGKVYVLEVNPRASRTVPFVAKATGVPVAKIAARIMAGEKLAAFNLSSKKMGHIAVKEAVFPFSRFPGVDTLLGPEMKSTGEVMGIDTDFARAFAKSQLGAGVNLPLTGSVFISIRDRDKASAVAIAAQLITLGFRVVATSGSAQFFQEKGLKVDRVNKVLEGSPHIVDAMINGEIDLVINTTEGAKSIADSFSIRQTALLNKIPYYTTIAGASAVAQGIAALQTNQISVKPIQEYLGGSF